MNTTTTFNTIRNLAGLLASIALFSSATPVHAQLAGSGTPGDRAAYELGANLGTIADVGTLPSGTHTWDFDAAGIAIDDVNNSFDLGADGGGDDTKLFLTAGHHIVLYGSLWDIVNERSNPDSYIKLNGTEIPYGQSSGYTRTTGNDEGYTRGGTILEVAQNDYIEIESRRIDVYNAASGDQGTRGITQVNGDLQVIMLDEANLDFARLKRTTSAVLIPASDTGTPKTVVYEASDELDTTSFAWSAGANGDQVTLKGTGHYLVFANTGFDITTKGSNRRNCITQRLKLGSNTVVGSETVLYLRNSGSGDGTGGLCDEGTASVGVIVETTAPNQILTVEVQRDSSGDNSVASVDHDRTGLAIVKLPSYGDYISLEESGSANNADVNTAVAARSFASHPDVSNASFDYASATSASQVVVNKAEDYLFLGSHFVENANPNGGTESRTIVEQGFSLTPSGGSASAVSYGTGGTFNRDNQAAIQRSRDSGAWGAAVLNLGMGDAVEMTTEQVGDGATIPPTNMSFQGINITSISSPPADPVIAVNNPISVIVNSVGTVIDGTSLSTTDPDAGGPGNIQYTITNVPTGGNFELVGTGTLGNGSTFTQAQVDAGDLTFDAGASELLGGGFTFSVADTLNGGTPATGTFVANVGVALAAMDDTGSTDEDTVASVVAGGSSVLDNDTGTSLSVLSADTSSANGAAVSVAANGTFTYDPTGSSTLQALDTGATPVMDTFSYTVIDFQGTQDTRTVTIDVSGVNDAPVAAADSATITNVNVLGLNVLDNDTDVDLPADTLTMTVFDTNAVPGTYTTAKGATVTVLADGSLTYDPSSSSTLLALAPGATDSEVLNYTVDDGTASTVGTVTVTIVGSTGAIDDVATVNATVITDPADPPVSISALANDTVTSGAAGTPTTANLLVEFDAATAGNTNTTWNNTGSGGATGPTITMGAGATLDLAPVNVPVGITAVYSMSGTNSGSTFDAPPVNPGAATNPFGSGGAGGVSDLQTSWEFVFRPTDHIGNESIFDSGGSTTGCSLVLLGDQLVFTLGDGGAIAGQAVATMPPGAVAGGEFVHVVVLFRDDGADRMDIYVNGTLAGLGPGTNYNTGVSGVLQDWSGTGGAGLGSAAAGSDGGNIGPLGNFGSIDLPTLTDFDGEMALVRVYNNKLLNTVEIANNFAAIFGGASATPVAADVAELAGNASPVIDTAYNVTTTGTGTSTVTLKSDGTFEYDPGGAFDNVGSGLTATDSFTYKLNNPVNDTATVVVTINGTFVQTVDTEVSLVGTVLTITDIKAGGNDSAFELTSDGTNLTISEKNSGLIDAIGTLDGATGDGTNDVTIPHTSFDGINVVSGLGTDSVAINSPLDLGADSLTVDAETISSLGSITNATTVSLTGTTTLAAGVSITSSGAVTFTGNTTFGSGSTVDSSAGNGAITFGGTLQTDTLLETLSLNSGSGAISFNGDVGTTAIPYVGYTNLGTGLATFAAGTQIHTQNGRTTFTGPGEFLILGSIGESPALTGQEAGLFADGDAKVTFGNTGNAATLNIADASGGSETFETSNGGHFAFINLSAPVVFTDSIRNAEAGNGSITIGDGTAGGAPTLDFNNGNIEVALGNPSIGTFEFLSGTINLNSSNFITGQGVGSQAGTPGDPVTIGGGSVEAHLNLNATVVGDWNTNSGTGYAEILTNGRVTLSTMNLGNNATETNDGLDLTINGGTLELTGNIDFRTGGAGDNDKITLLAGVLDGDADGAGGGTIFLRDSATTAFDFQGGTMKAFASFNDTLTQDGGTLQVGTDTSNGSSMSIGGDYDMNAGALEITLGDVGAGAGVGFDLLAVGGALDLTGTGTLSLSAGPGYVPATLGTSFTVVTYAGALTSTFGNSGDAVTLTRTGGEVDVFTIDYTSTPGEIILTLVTLDDDALGPVATTFDPVDGASNVPATTNITVTFDEFVQPVNGAGSVRLINVTDADEVEETWTYSGGTLDSNLGGGNPISIVGTVLTIDPTNLLESGDQYRVEFTGSAHTTLTTPIIEDALGQAYAGIDTYDFAVASAPSVTIEQASGQDDPTSELTIDFDVVFTESVTGFGDVPGDVVLSGLTTDSSLATVSGSGTTYTVAVDVSGIGSDGILTATIPAGAATGDTTLQLNLASTSIDNSVSYIFNFAPTAQNLDQDFLISALPLTSFDLNDIVVSDPNSVGTTAITTADAEFIDYPAGTGTGGGGNDNTTSFTSSDPTDANGFTMEVVFTPTLADLDCPLPVVIGSENRRVVFETGGSSNGSGIYLIDGIPYFISKMGGNGSTAQSALLDTVFDNGGVCVPLSTKKLNAGEANTIAIKFSLSNLAYSVNGSPEANQVLTGQPTINWAGNNSVRIGIASGPGGIADNNGSGGLATFVGSGFSNLSGSVGTAKLWNASGGTISFNTVQTDDEFTVTLTVQNGTGATLAATQNTGAAVITGSGTGVLTISGKRCDVNLALLTLQITSGGSPAAVETISVTADDGDEDGSGALTGTIFLAQEQNGLFVDDGFSGSLFDPIADADLGTTGSQAGSFGVDSFATLQEALDRAAAGATVIVNGGTLNETVTVPSGITLEVTGPDAAQAVAIDGLNSAAGATIDIEGTSTLTVGNGSNTSVTEGDITNTSGTGTLAVSAGSTLQIGNGGTSGSVAFGISNSGTVAYNRSDAVVLNANDVFGTGGVTQAGTGTLTLLGAHTYTGTTTGNAGILSIGDGTTTGSLPSGALITTNAIVRFNPAAGESVTADGVISGTGSVQKRGTGTLVMSAQHTYSGGTALGQSSNQSTNVTRITVDAVGSHPSITSGPLGTGTVSTLGARLSSDTTDRTVPNAVTFDSGGGNSAFLGDGSNNGKLTFSGPVTLTDNSRSLTIDSDVEFLGGVGESPAASNYTYVKSGAGTVTFSGPNTNGGLFTNNAGTVILLSTATDVGGIRVVNGTLSGDGTTSGPVTIETGGVLSPGLSIGTLGTGDLTVNGTLQVEVMNSTGSAGTDWDHVTSTKVTLGGASIVDVVDLSTTTEASPGEITVVTNSSGDAGNTFGAFATVTGGNDYLGSGFVVEAGYDGPATSGNDVVLNPSATLGILGNWRTVEGLTGAPADTGNAGNGFDVDSDMIVNLLEFGFGLDPNTTNGIPNKVTIDKGASTWTLGTQTTYVDFGNANIFTAVFAQRSDRVAAGITYTPQFNDGDLLPGNWMDVTVAPTRVEDDSNVALPPVTPSGYGDGVAYELYEVPYPFFLPTGKKAQYFRIRIDTEQSLNLDAGPSGP